jgi:hypothetical protein
VSHNQCLVNRPCVWPVKKRLPQRLKPESFCAAFGMTEVMPCYKASQFGIFRDNEAAQ